MWLRSQNTKLDQSPKPSLHRRHELPIPLDRFPAKYQQTFRVFTGQILIALLWSMQPSKGWGWITLNYFRIPKNTVSSPFICTNRKHLMVMWRWLNSSPECQWLQDELLRAKGPTSANTHSVPCKAPFCHVTNANLNVFYWDFRTCQTQEQNYEQRSILRTII